MRTNFFQQGIFYWFVDTETNTVRSDKVKKAIKILIDFSFICILVVGVRHILIEYSSSAAVHPSTATGGFSSLWGTRKILNKIVKKCKLQFQVKRLMTQA